MKFLRICIETLFIFSIVNVVFAWINPPIKSLEPFNRILPGFQRFPILQTAVIKKDGTVNYSTEVISDLDILLPSHYISGQQKSKDEYRIILLGDSSARGAGLSIEQTLAGQINQSNLRSCDNRSMVVYNLGLPGPALKDLMILSEAMKNYDPDLVIWTFTMDTFQAVDALQQRQDRIIISSNIDRIRALEKITGHQFLTNYNLPKTTSFIDRTIYGRAGELNLLLRLSLLDINYMSIGTDEPRMLVDTSRIQKKAVDKNDNYADLKSGDNVMDILDVRLLLSASKIAKEIPIIYVNEPIYSRKQNPVRYNESYPRWAYDQYRSAFHNLIETQSWIYLDLWDQLPPSEFSNSAFHRTAKGETLMAQVLIPVILDVSCEK